MKKKITAALVCAIMALSLAGCAANEGEPESTKRERSTKDESSYSEPESKPDESKPEESSSDSKPDESSSDSKPEESSSDSQPEKPSEPEPLNVDWSSVPVVDEMDLDYTVFEAGDIYYEYYKETFREKYKELYKDGVVLVTKYFGDAEYINLPDQIEGKSCILIGADVDWGDNAKAIRFSESSPFPNSTRIETGLGGYSIGVGKAVNLTEVVMPDSTESIGAFGGMPKLEIINIPNSIVYITIMPGAFSGCTALKSVTVPENVEYINLNAFSGCTALETVNFPKKFARECVINTDAFAGCTSLKSVEIPEGVKQMGSSRGEGRVFAGCTSLTKVSLPGTVKEIGSETFSGCTSLTEVTLSEGLEEINWGVFRGCTSLSEINLPSGLKTIGENAFSGCTSLKSIDIPDSVTNIARGAFSGCEGISINYKGKTYTEKNVEKLYGKDLSKI